MASPLTEHTVKLHSSPRLGVSQSDVTWPKLTVKRRRGAARREAMSRGNTKGRTKADVYSWERSRLVPTVLSVRWLETVQDCHFSTRNARHTRIAIALEREQTTLYCIDGLVTSTVATYNLNVGYHCWSVQDCHFSTRNVAKTNFIARRDLVSSHDDKLTKETRSNKNQETIPLFQYLPKSQEKSSESKVKCDSRE
ncbi:hypothetical protein J6590_048329 [Homalodisca vitripennis]|nr:hypothetical protein J6590_048329 [Homalodisca vitripennis]